MSLAMKLREDIRALAVSLSVRLAEHAPCSVVGIARGGQQLGALVAEQLKVPFYTLDLSYPGSRPWLGRLGEAFLFPIKEVLYRVSSPRLNSPSFFAEGVDGVVALVDDTASSGRTLRAAFDALGQAGISREQVVVAVVRCGPRARSLVTVALR
jgi:pyrimidine operon attenuation protein/uracil phosphoribosyltransferase